jgi:hypothetical protein
MPRKPNLTSERKARVRALLNQRRRRTGEQRDLQAVRKYQRGEVERVWTPGVGWQNIIPLVRPCCSWT